MLAYVFPGQGAQFKGMGEGLWERFPEHVAQADTVLGYSVSRLCLEDPDGKLTQTAYTQPALYVVNHLFYLAALEDNGQEPDYVAGHSLGEYNALLASGAFDFETGLRLVCKRGALMASADRGGMAAVLGLTVEQIRTALRDNALSRLDLANMNTRYQTIISGPANEIAAAERPIANAGGQLIPLRVSGAFHSREMSDASEAFSDYLRPYEFNWLRIPVISNVQAAPYPQGEIKALLAAQIASPVRWLESVEYLLAHGVRRIEQVGPGNVLTDMVTRIRNERGEPAGLVASSS
ncbi:ACP S-malonyltransferase [Arhodomonas sp. AD133]|uniref:ACP S-malonyltransferase n=1 Tax=Arhodomonas sp. AD133 TaxID=3415009 RepID=UPI003EB7F0E9